MKKHEIAEVLTRDALVRIKLIAFHINEEDDGYFYEHALRLIDDLDALFNVPPTKIKPITFKEIMDR